MTVPGTCASINIYNEKDCLPYALKSLKDFETVIVVDGKWRRFNDPNANPEGLSYDGSREIAKSFPNVVLLDCGNQTEEAMSNMCMREAGRRGYDFLLQIAADEFVKGNLKTFMENAKQRVTETPNIHTYFVNFKIKHITPPDQQYKEVQRLIYLPMFVRLRDIHWIYFFADKKCEIGSQIKGLDIVHDDRPREAAREAQMKTYQDMNVPRERMLFEHQVTKMLEDSKLVISLPILQALLPQNTITAEQSMKGDTIYVITGHEIPEHMKEKLLSHFNVHTWVNKKGFNVKHFRFTKCQ